MREKENEMLISEQKCLIYCTCYSVHVMFVFIYIYTYVHMGEYCIDTCLYIYSHPKVDRIFFGGCGIYVGIMLDVGHLKINR